MLYDLDKTLTDFEGEPMWELTKEAKATLKQGDKILDEHKEDIVYRDILIKCLLTTDDKDKKQSFEDVILAKEIKEAKDIELKSEQVTRLKVLSEKAYPGQKWILFQIDQYLEGKI